MLDLINWIPEEGRDNDDLGAIENALQLVRFCQNSWRYPGWLRLLGRPTRTSV